MALDGYFYFSLICSLGGVTFFIISLLIISKIKKLFPATNLRKKWVIIQGLIILFLFGYMVNIVVMVLQLTEIGAIMVAIVYIFGGLFVLIVVNLSYKTYKTILLGKKD